MYYRPDEYVADRAKAAGGGDAKPIDLGDRERIEGAADWYEELIKNSGGPEAAGLISAAFDPFDIEENGGTITTAPESAGDDASEDPAPKDEGEASGEAEVDADAGDVWRARILLLIAAALYGTNFTMVKVLDESVPVGIGTALRFAMAALATLPWLLMPSGVPPEEEEAPAPADEAKGAKEGGASAAEPSTTDGEGLRGVWDAVRTSTSAAAALAGFEAGMWNSIGYVSQAVGLETTEASKSAFICSLAVVVVPILDFLAGKKFLPRELVGAALAVAGVGLLETGGGSISDGLTSGDVASLVQPFAFGLGFWRMEDAMRRYPSEATRMTAAQVMAVFCASLSYCLLSSGGGGDGGAPPLPPASQIVDWLTDPSILGALLWTGVVTTALTVYMETLALKTLTAAETTMIFSTEPLWGSAFAAVVVGERFGLEAGVGAALILTGCVYSNVGMDWFRGEGGEEGEGGDEVEEEEEGGGGASSSSSTSSARLADVVFASSLVGMPVGAAAAAEAIDVRAVGDAAQSAAEVIGESI